LVNGSTFPLISAPANCKCAYGRSIFSSFILEAKLPHNLFQYTPMQSNNSIRRVRRGDKTPCWKLIGGSSRVQIVFPSQASFFLRSATFPGVGRVRPDPSPPRPVGVRQKNTLKKHLVGRFYGFCSAGTHRLLIHCPCHIDSLPLVFEQAIAESAGTLGNAPASHILRRASGGRGKGFYSQLSPLN